MQTDEFFNEIYSVSCVVNNLLGLNNINSIRILIDVFSKWPTSVNDKIESKNFKLYLT